MSKIDELIKEMCPNGVEYKALKSVSCMQRGNSLTKSRATEGNIPVISGGKEPAFFCDISNRDGEIITVAGSGVGAGYVQYWNIPIYANDCFTIKGNDDVVTKYLYYFMANIQNQIYKTKKGGGVPHVHISDIENFKIPIPPLPIQREIVRILDSFTELTEELTKELTKELTARKKQYEFYRDELLKFDNDMQMVKLGELCKITRGIRVTRSELNSDSGYPVYQNSLTPMGYYNKPNRKANTSFIISAGAAGEIGYSNEDYWAADDCLTFECPSSLNDRFLYHFFKTKQEYLYSRVRKASIPRLSREVLEKLEIPFLPIEIQNQLVSVLDNFDAICSDLNIGLPAEIEARQKQYEYYRDMLLTFAEKGEIIPDRQTDRQTSNN